MVDFKKYVKYSKTKFGNHDSMAFKKIPQEWSFLDEFSPTFFNFTLRNFLSK